MPIVRWAWMKLDAMLHSFVFHPEQKCWYVLQALVLPFGALKSVHSVLWLARAVWL